MPTLAELLGMAPSSDVAMPYLWPSPKPPTGGRPAPVTSDTWPPKLSTSAVIPSADDDSAATFRGILGDHPAVREVSAPPSGGILGGLFPAATNSQPPATPNVGQGLLGLRDAWPASAMPIAGPDWSRVLPYPDSVPKASDAAEPDYFTRVLKRVRDNFGEAYAEPLGPGPEYRALIEPVITKEGPWAKWWTRPIYEALLLNVPQLADAALRFQRPAYNSLVDAAVVERGVSIGLDRGDMERWGREFKAFPEAFAGAPGTVWPGSPPALPILKGQIHHPISKVVHDALERHPNLKGLYSRRDPRYETQAVDLPAHNGWWGWHKDFDEEVADYIDAHPELTQQQFEAYMKQRYEAPDMLARFPLGWTGGR